MDTVVMVPIITLKQSEMLEQGIIELLDLKGLKILADLYSDAPKYLEQVTITITRDTPEDAPRPDGRLGSIRVTTISEKDSVSWQATASADIVSDDYEAD